MKTVLTIAGSDCSGGAGIQADMLTLAGMGCHALTVITALTVQDTAGVEDVLAVDADFVSEQARAVLEDMPVQAFKLGVLGSVENIEVIAEIISDYPHIPVVVDPKGSDFSRYRGATVVKPNLSEFEAVVGPCPDEATLVARGEALCAELGLEALLVTRSEQGVTLLQKGQPAHHQLSPRELQILQLIVRGVSLTEIGQRMFLSVKTVSTYRTRLMEKMSLSSNSDLTYYAMTNGLIQ